MSIEAHLTVSYSPATEARFLTWLAEAGLRVTTLELPRGSYPVHTMVTAWWPSDCASALREAGQLRDALARLEVDVKRTKLETAPAADGHALYFEHHVKVAVPPSRVGALAELAGAFDAHVARNARRRVLDLEERYLTQRFTPEVHGARAREALRGLVEALERDGLRVKKVVRERVIHDDNLALDAGWARVA